MNDTRTTSPAPADVLAAFTWFASTVHELPASALADLADAFDSLRGRRRRRVAAIAQHASDLAYDLDRIHVPDNDELPEDITAEEYETAAAGTVVGAPAHLASIAALTKLGDDELAVALIVGLAVLVHDQLTARDYEEVTGWWAAAGGPLPSTFNGPDRAPGEPVVDQPNQPTTAPRRRRLVAPPAGATAPRHPEQVRSRRTRTVNRSTPALLGFLIVAFIFGAIACLALGFAHLAMGDGAGIWWISLVACGVGVSITAAIRRQAIARSRR